MSYVSGSLLALQNVVDDLTPELGGTLDANGFNVNELGDVTFKTGAQGGTLRTGTSAADKFTLQAYDVNDGVYRTILELDAGNSPVMQFFDDYVQFEDATDPTKIVKFDGSAVSTGTTRTLTFPDASGTFALTSDIINRAFDTKADLEAATVPSSVDGVVVLGYTSAGDAGGARYKRAASEPSHGGKIQSADGAWWELAEPVVTPQMFGATGDGTTDDRAAFAALDAYGKATYIPAPTVNYNVSSPINLEAAGIYADPIASWEALTDSGNITWDQNMFTQDDPPVPTHRWSGRAFFGDAAYNFAGGYTPGVDGNDRAGAWYGQGASSAPTTEVFGGYLFRDATVAIANSKGTTALAVATRSSDRWNVSWNAPIGMGSFINNDLSGQSTWAHIIEGRAQHANGLTIGMEFALGNCSGTTKKADPYNPFDPAGGGGVYGLWFAGGGDASSGNPSDAPNNSPMVVLKNGTNTGLDGGWATGIVFTSDGLKGTDGSSGSTTFADAINMGRNQRVNWYEPTNEGIGFSITSRVTASSGAWRVEALDNKLNLLRSDGSVFFEAASNSITVNGASDADAVIDRNASTDRADVVLRTNGSSDWALGTIASSSNFYILRYNAGAYQDAPFSISNSTGNVTITKDLTTNGNITVDSAGTGGFIVDRADSTSYVAAYSFQTAGVEDWLLATLSGGTDLSLLRYSGGVFQDVPFSVATSTGNVTISKDLVVSGRVKTTATTVASLPTAASAGAGARSFVTDATATTFASVVAGGGANGVPVYSDGTNWRIG